MNARTLVLSLCALFIVTSLFFIGYFIIQNDSLPTQTQSDSQSEKTTAQTVKTEEDTIELRSTRNIDKEFGVAIRTYENANYSIEILVKTPSASQQFVAYAVKDSEEIRLGSLIKDEDDGSYVLAYSGRKDLSGKLAIYIKDSLDITILTGKN